MWGLDVRDEKLRAIRVGSCIGHREQARFIEFPARLELVLERVWNLLSIKPRETLDAHLFGTARAIAHGITALYHEISYDTVKFQAIIKAFFHEEEKGSDRKRRILVKQINVNCPFTSLHLDLGHSFSPSKEYPLVVDRPSSIY